MKIMILGSMSFSKEMMAAKAELERLGHVVNLPCDIDLHLGDNNLIDDLEKDLEHCKENQILRRCFNLLSESDAVLLLNYPKNRIDGYVGTSSLMELGIAYHLNKKIFIMNQIPDARTHRWAHEINVMEPVIINKNLNLIK
ncbi:hypothetical protein GF343_02750 [Candidatus Woesearchaeota archaeon]|nr:hypothetical protein [Candidatus Woesearchaeota archaeon]